MICKTCGAEINDDAIVCVNCGCATQNLSSDPQDKATSGLLLCAFILPGLGLILAAYNFGKKRKKAATKYLIFSILGMVFVAVGNVAKEALIS